MKRYIIVVALVFTVTALALVRFRRRAPPFPGGSDAAAPLGIP